MKTLKMNEKLPKNQGVYLQITRFSAARVAHLVTYKKHYLGLHFVPGLEDYD